MTEYNIVQIIIFQSICDSIMNGVYILIILEITYKDTTPTLLSKLLIAKTNMKNRQILTLIEPKEKFIIKT